MYKNTTKKVQEFWEKNPCGSDSSELTGDRKKYFQKIEDYRYQQEPFIHSFTQFTRYRNKKVLEVGVGMGTDFIQFCRAGAKTHGIDLTDQSIKIVGERLCLEGLEANIQKMNAEVIPFESNFFDLVYSFGVIHHAENPQKIINEIYRVLKPRMEAKIMLYNRYSWVSFQYYLKYGLFACYPFKKLDDIMWHYRESLGTKVYSKKEIFKLFKKFSNIDINTVLTTSDYVHDKAYKARMENKGTVNKLFIALWPGFLVKLMGNKFGFYHLIKLIK